MRDVVKQLFGVQLVAAEDVDVVILASQRPVRSPAVLGLVCVNLHKCKVMSSII